MKMRSVEVGLFHADRWTCIKLIAAFGNPADAFKTLQSNVSKNSASSFPRCVLFLQLQGTSRPTLPSFGPHWLTNVSVSLGLQTLFVATCEDCDVFVHKISFQTINHLPYQDALDSETAQQPSADSSVTHTITDVQDCVCPVRNKCNEWPHTTNFIHPSLK